MSNLRSEPVLGPASHSDEWYRMRRKILGASEAAAVCGVSPYATAFDVYCEKVGLKEPPRETLPMRIGTALEPAMAAEYERVTACPPLERHLPMYFHGLFPFLAATPDCRRTDAERLVELKSTTFRRAAELGDDMSDYVPNDWNMQCQQQMEVMGVDQVDMGVLLDKNTFRLFQVLRNDELIAMIVMAAQELHERILNRDPPEPDWNHPRQAEVIKHLYCGHDSTVVQLDAETAGWWEESEQIAVKIAGLEQRKETLRAQVQQRMKDHAAGRLLDGRHEIVHIQVAEKEIAAYTRGAYGYLRKRKIPGRRSR